MYNRACIYGATDDVVSLLMKKYPEACKKIDVDGMAPLHLACDTDKPNISVVKLLLKEESTVTSFQRKIDGSTPLHLAISRKASPSVLKSLIRADDSILSKMDARGRIPLFIAIAIKADYETFELLLKKYPEGRHTKNKVNELPCTMAARMNLDKDIIRLLSDQHVILQQYP